MIIKLKYLLIISALKRGLQILSWLFNKNKTFAASNKNMKEKLDNEEIWKYLTYLFRVLFKD